MFSLPSHIPSIDEIGGQPLERTAAHARLIDRETGMAWYILAFDPPDRCLGIVVRKHAVVGEFFLGELESLRHSRSNAPVVELDTDFKPTAVRELARSDENILQIMPPSQGLVDLQP